MSLSNFILDLLAFIERCITRDLNFGMMYEHIRTTFVRSDEAKAFSSNTKLGFPLIPFFLKIDITWEMNMETFEYADGYVFFKVHNLYFIAADKLTGVRSLPLKVIKRSDVANLERPTRRDSKHVVLNVRFFLSDFINSPSRPIRKLFLDECFHFFLIPLTKGSNASSNISKDMSEGDEYPSLVVPERSHSS